MSDNEWTHDWNRDATFPRAKVYDAEGQRMYSVLRCNVDTGQLERQDYDEGSGDLETIRETRPAPLTVVFHE